MCSELVVENFYSDALSSSSDPDWISVLIFHQQYLFTCRYSCLLVKFKKG
jgi:hypothetical protein